MSEENRGLSHRTLCSRASVFLILFILLGIIDYRYWSPETGFAARTVPNTLTSILLVALIRGQLFTCKGCKIRYRVQGRVSDVSTIHGSPNHLFWTIGHGDPWIVAPV